MLTDRQTQTKRDFDRQMLTTNNDKETNGDGDRAEDGEEAIPSGRAIPVCSPPFPTPNGNQ